MTWDPDDLEIDLSNFDAEGGRPQPQSLTDLYSTESLWKAKTLLSERDSLVQDPIKQYLWTVQGSKTYVVRDTQVEGLEIPWLTCTCPNGDARGGRPSCYHTAAVAAKILGDDLSWVERPKKVGKR